MTSIPDKTVKTLDKDLGRIGALEQAVAYAARPLAAPGLALAFLVLVGLSVAAFAGLHATGLTVVAAAIIGAYMALNIGANDVANNMGPAVGARALRWLADLCAVSHPASLDWNPIALLDHMSHADEVAYCPLTFCYTNYARDGYAPHLVRFADIPGVRGALLGGAGFAVSARCAHPRAAIDYGVWLCSAAVQRTLIVEQGGQPGNAAAWTDPDANRLTHDFFRDTFATIRAAYVRPRHAGFVRFQEAAGRVIHAMLRDGGDVDACLAELIHLYRVHLPSPA